MEKDTQKKSAKSPAAGGTSGGYEPPQLRKEGAVSFESGERDRWLTVRAMPYE